MNIALVEFDLADETVGPASPYGKLSEEQLQSFEREIGWKLPDSYRRYLTDHNGAKFVKDIYPVSDDGWDCVTLHHVFGLHDGPSHSRLQEKWKLYECYDLHRWKRKLKNYVAFADTGTGDIFAIRKDASIWFYEHDAPSGFFGMPGRFTKIENSFVEFLTKLQSNKDFETKFADDPRFKAFKAELERLKAGRRAARDK